MQPRHLFNVVNTSSFCCILAFGPTGFYSANPHLWTHTYQMGISRPPYIDKQRPWFMTEKEKEDNGTNLLSQSANVLQRAAERNSFSQGSKGSILDNLRNLCAQASLTSLWLCHWKKKPQKRPHSSPTPPGNKCTTSRWFLGSQCTPWALLCPFPTF